MMNAIWQVPLCAVGVYCFYLGATNCSRWLFNRIDTGFALLCGGALVARPPKRSWKGVLLRQMILLAVAVFLWKQLC
jgi:hypothetical protein